MAINLFRLIQIKNKQNVNSQDKHADLKSSSAVSLWCWDSLLNNCSLAADPQ
jgi:hypothetical protein